VFRAANMGSNFKMMRDRPMVTVELKWQLDPGGSESVMTFVLY
jgi:hypothetical protein